MSKVGRQVLFSKTLSSKGLQYTCTPTTSEYPNHDYWNAKSEEDVDLDAPFYEDQLSGFNGTLAANLPIQGSCAEVMMVALARLHAVLRDQPATLIATVHDEAVFWCQTTCRLPSPSPARKEMVAAFLDVFPSADIQLGRAENRVELGRPALHGRVGHRRSNPIKPLLSLPPCRVDPGCDPRVLALFSGRGGDLHRPLLAAFALIY